MAYVGVSPSNGVRRVHTYTVSGSSTDTFSGAGAEGTTLSYKDSNYVDVYQNGVKLADADYTATSGTSIVLGTTASDGDIVEIIYIPATAMYPNTTNGCASIAQVELSNGPEIKVLDFDASSDENAQFTVAFPNSWNEGTVTFQAFFTVTGTNTGTVAWGLSGVAIADNDSCNTAFGTNVVATAKAHSGTEMI